MARAQVPFVSGWRDPDLTGIFYEFCINMQPTFFDGQTKTFAMVPSPGNERFYQIQAALSEDVIRGMIVMEGHIYVFAGANLIELTPTVVSNQLTTFSESVYTVTSTSGASFTNTTPVRFAFSNLDNSGNPELGISLQDSTNSWELLSFSKTEPQNLIHLDGGTYNGVVSRDMVGSTDLIFLDNRFIVTKGAISANDQSTFDVSPPAPQNGTNPAGTTVPRLRAPSAAATSADLPWQFGSIARNDKAKGLATNNGNYFLFGERLVQTWTDAGLAGLPFRPIQGQTYNYGTPSQFSIATGVSDKGDDVTVFLSRDDKGALSVIKLGSQGAVPISNRQVEGYFADFVTNPFDAIAFMYREDSDLYYHITFPTDDLTFVYDFEHNEWTKREWYDGKRHIANAFVFYDQTGPGEADLFDRINFIGDYQSKRIYKFSSEIYIYADNGTTRYPAGTILDGVVLDQESVRQNTGIAPPANDTSFGEPFKARAIPKTIISPIFDDSQERIITLNRLELVSVQGTGRTDYNVTNYTEDQNPAVTVRVSMDRGRTYTIAQESGIGEAGFYKTRTRFVGLGSTTDGFVCKVQSYSKQPIIFLKAVLDYTIGEE